MPPFGLDCRQLYRPIRRNDQRASQRERPRFAGGLRRGLNRRRAIAADSNRGKPGDRGALEQQHLVQTNTDQMLIIKRAWRADALLSMTKRSLQRNLQLHLRVTAILHGERVHCPRHIGITTVRRENRSPDHQCPNGTGKGRQPSNRPLPRNAFRRQHPYEAPVGIVAGAELAPQP